MHDTGKLQILNCFLWKLFDIKQNGIFAQFIANYYGYCQAICLAEKIGPTYLVFMVMWYMIKLVVVEVIKLVDCELLLCC